MRKRLKNHFIPHEGNDYKPHFVREKNVVSIAIIAVAIFSLVFSLNSFVTRHPDLLSAVITGVLVDLTNSNRLSQNLDPLTSNPILASAAQLKANDMAEKNYFAHTSPEGRTPWYWFTKSDYQFLYAGENLAVNFADSEDVVRAWMNSEGHRANILSDKFSEIGIAMAPGKYNGQNSIYVVQLFGHPIPQRTTAPVAAVAENVEVLAENELFIAVQNNDYPNDEAVLSADTEIVAQSSVVDRTLASPKTTLKFVYLGIGGVILVALVLFVMVEPRRQHLKNILYVVLLLILIGVLLYLSSTYLFTQTLVK